MTLENEQPAGKRQPYEKPEIKSISLVADQVLANPCKTNVSPYTGASIGNWGCYLIICSQTRGS